MKNTAHHRKLGSMLIVGLGWLQCERGNEKYLSIVNQQQWKGQSWRLHWAFAKAGLYDGGEMGVLFV